MSLSPEEQLEQLKEELTTAGLEPVTENNYVANCLRTESMDWDAIKERLSDLRTIRLLHASLGLVTEAAELADMLKKSIFYGRDIDRVNAREEVGDVMWYVGVAVDVMQTTMREIMQTNIDKLRTRFPDKFTEHHANKRDLDAEHKILAQKVEETGDPEIKQAFGQALLRKAGVDCEKELEAMSAETEKGRKVLADVDMVDGVLQPTFKSLVHDMLSDPDKCGVGFGGLPEEITQEEAKRISEEWAARTKGMRTFVSTPRDSENPFFRLREEARHRAAEIRENIEKSLLEEFSGRFIDAQLLEELRVRASEYLSELKAEGLSLRIGKESGQIDVEFNIGVDISKSKDKTAVQITDMEGNPIDLAVGDLINVCFEGKDWTIGVANDIMNRTLARIVHEEDIEGFATDVVDVDLEVRSNGVRDNALVIAITEAGGFITMHTPGAKEDKDE